MIKLLHNSPHEALEFITCGTRRIQSKREARPRVSTSNHVLTKASGNNFRNSLTCVLKSKAEFLEQNRIIDLAINDRKKWRVRLAANHDWPSDWSICLISSTHWSPLRRRNFSNHFSSRLEKSLVQTTAEDPHAIHTRKPSVHNGEETKLKKFEKKLNFYKGFDQA